MTNTTTQPAPVDSPLATFFGNMLGAVLVGTIEDNTK